MTLVIDLSNWSAVPTADQVECFRNQGVVLAVVGTSFGTVSGPQLAALEGGGIPCEEYQFPRALRATTRPLWLDAEEQDATVDSLRAAISSRKPKGIYTRKNWWEDNTGNWDVVSEFPDLLLWEAHYGDPIPPFEPFGGWTSRHMVQYADTVQLCGIGVDLSQMEDDMALSDEDKQAIAAIVKLEIQLALNQMVTDGQIVAPKKS